VKNNTLTDNTNVNIFSIPGLSIDLKHMEGILQLDASGHLRAVCTPFLNKINACLKEEKPALVDEDRVIASTWLPPIPGKVFNRLLYAETQIALGKYVPETASFEITRECKCNCEHCVVSGGEGDMDIDSIKRAIDEALDMGAFIITFTEGDPLLREEIFELIEYVDKDRAIVNIFTPGTEITPEVAKRLKDAGLHSLLVSVYSTDPKKHDLVRRLDNAYDMATAAIKCGLDAGLLVTMTTHVSPKNINELQEMYDLASELGVHEFSLWESVPKQAGDAILSDDDRKVILDMYHKVNSTKGGPRIFSNTFFEGEMLGCLAGQRWSIWKKIRSYPQFKGERHVCLMHDPNFMELVSKIPKDAKVPYDFDLLKQ
jgi:MoaA/NifB/PqqE/SkfB family radical SAM enzyme